MIDFFVPVCQDEGQFRQSNTTSEVICLSMINVRGCGLGVQSGSHNLCRLNVAAACCLRDSSSSYRGSRVKVFAIASKQFPAFLSCVVVIFFPFCQFWHLHSIFGLLIWYYWNQKIWGQLFLVSLKRLFALDSFIYNLYNKQLMYKYTL